MTVTAFEAAAHLCKAADWSLSNLQLQKVLYLADMNFVGQGNRRLFEEPFEAWDYGPVVPRLYHHLKIFGSKPVQDVFWKAGSIDGSVEAQILERAYQATRYQSPAQLVENTHWSGGAWAKRYRPGVRGILITEADMADEYQKRKERRAHRPPHPTAA